MRRFPALALCLALCFALAGCGHRYLPENTPAPAPEEPVETGTAPEEPLHFETLGVEFSAGGRDVNGLLALQAAFPDALRRAFAGGGVTADEVAVTFGTSGEATELALQKGAVQLAFLPAEDHYPYRSGVIAAVERGDPDLSLGLLVTAVTDDAAADARFANAVRDALPALRRVLASYTGAAADGVYTFDAELLEQLDRLYRTGDAVLHSESAAGLTLRGVGHRLNEYVWGIRAVEVLRGDELLQTVELSEAADDPDGGPDEYTSCPEPALLFRAVDVNFDGYEDLEVFGWTTNNTIPYFYWLWDPDLKQFSYAFRLQGTTVDPDQKTLRAEYRDGAVLWRDVYEWQDGALVRVGHEQAET